MECVWSFHVLTNNFFLKKKKKKKKQGEFFEGRWHGKGVLTQKGHPPVKGIWSRGKLQQTLE